MGSTVICLGIFASAATLSACGSDDRPAAEQVDARDTTPNADAAGQPDAAPAEEMESEPNDGASLTEINEVTVGAVMHGAIGTANDSDVFHFDAAPGTLYRLQLRADDGSPLLVHLTAMDAGRDGAGAGGDYVKIDIPGSSPANVEVLAMGQGGYYAVVRDARNVGGGGGEGSSAHGYTLSVSIVGQPNVTPLVFPSTNSETLASAGAVKLYSFDGVAGTDFVIDMQASGDSDGRLILFSEATGDWIARNDDRGGGDSDPLLDAPLTASGTMILMVENINPEASSLGFSLTSATP